MDTFARAREFILKNARPLDKARWQFLFEGGNREEVIEILQTYQNADGGFGHALEPDCWNPNSTPMQTWVATCIIEEIGLEDANNPLIQGILMYLASGAEWDGHRWHGLNTVRTNNDYPHAPWWAYTEKEELSYNPTASLIGFILKYEQKDTEFYQQTCNLAREAYAYFEAHFPLESMHEAACFVELYDAMKACGCTGVVNLEQFRDLLQEQIKQLLTYDTKRWSTEYICKPSLFIKNTTSDFYKANQALCIFECDFIREYQQKDGTWQVTWTWPAYPEQWAISKNWWQADIIIKNMRYMKAFEGCVC